MFLKKLFQLVPSDPLTHGLDLFNDGESEESLLVFETLVDSDDVGIRDKARLYACEAHLQLGDQHRSQDSQKALHHYLAATDYQPTFADIHNKAGETYRRLGKLEEGAETFRKALAINERYFLARLNLAQTLVELNQLTLAGGEVRLLRASCPALFRELADELLSACDQRDNQRLGQIFAEIRNLDPDRISLTRDRALAMIRRGDPMNAARILEKLVEECPRFPDLHHILGLAYGDMGRRAEAMARFRQALELNDKYLKARINLGVTLMEEEQWDEARTELERVLSVDPVNPLAKNALREIDAMRSTA